MKRVLVTGSSGQLGMCIQKNHKDFPEIQFIFTSSKELDITNVAAIKKYFESNKFDYCINCVAYTNVDQAEREPEKAFAVNAKGVKNIAKACQENDVVLVHISTDYVFDGEKRTPYTVDDSPNPINEYGRSKLKGEQYIQEILERYFIIRTSWLYSEYGNNFYKTILEKAKTEKILFVTNEQTGSPTKANNLAKFICDMIESNNCFYGIYHFTDGETTTWYDFAKQIVKENGLNTIVEAKNYTSFAARPLYGVMTDKK